MKTNTPALLYLLLTSVLHQASYPMPQANGPGRADELRGQIAKAQRGEKLLLLNELTSVLIDIDPRQAEPVNLEALELARTTADHTQAGFAWLGNARIQHAQGRFAQALRAVEEAKSLFSKTNDSHGLFLCHYHRGRTALAMDDFPGALASLQNALRMEGLFSDHPVETLLIHIKLAILHNRLRDFPSAQKIVERGIGLAREMKDWKHLGYLYNQAAIIAGSKDDFAAEIALYEKAKACFEQIGDRFETLLIEHNMGVLYKNTDRIEPAIRHLEMARSGFRNLNRHTEVFQAEINLGQAYAEISRHTEARHCFDMAMATLEKQNLSNQHWAVTAFAEYCEQIGDHREAAHYYRKAAELNEALFNETRERQIGLLRESFEAESREQKILLLEKDRRISQISRNLLGFILLSVLLFLAMMMKRVSRWLAFWKKHQYIGQYRIIQTIAAGGMGIVYLAHPQNAKQERVAIKVLKEGSDQDPSVIKRFRREGEVIDRLDHPNIVRILERGIHRDRPYIVMEYIAGNTLEAELQIQSLPLPMGLRIMLQAADALREIHAQGIVHGDIKAQNIMIRANLPPGEAAVKIFDFGLAKVAHHTRLTTVGFLMGTMTHTAPELFHHSEPGPATDVYALGVVCYQVFTGSLPFAADAEAMLLERILNTTPKRLAHIKPEIPPTIDTLVLSMLRKTPGDRPDAGEVVRVIHQVLGTLGTD